MSPRTTIRLLGGLCALEAVALLALLARQSEEFAPLFHPETLARPVPQPVAAPAPASPSIATAADLPPRYAAMEKELAEVKQELETRKAEISFSYGTLRDSGRFVGMTFRKMFEAAAAREAKEAQAKLADNQINVLSLGPFIQDAEVMEADPGAFAQFQTALIGEMLELPPERRPEIETLLSDLKTRSLKVEAGSPEWVRLNDQAMQQISAMLSPNRQVSAGPEIEFLQRYGVLMIPAYSILGAPTPTVAPLPTR